jgi:RES domain-containing protein
VSLQRLDRVLTSFRIGDPDGIYQIFDGSGAALMPGRWTERGQPAIYTCEPYSTAMLEKLARGRGGLPRNQHYITITVPNGATCEVVGRDHLPGWDTVEPPSCAASGLPGPPSADRSSS